MRWTGVYSQKNGFILKLQASEIVLFYDISVVNLFKPSTQITHTASHLKLPQLPYSQRQQILCIYMYLWFKSNVFSWESVDSSKMVLRESNVILANWEESIKALSMVKSRTRINHQPLWQWPLSCSLTWPCCPCISRHFVVCSGLRCPCAVWHPDFTIYTTLLQIFTDQFGPRNC